VAVIETYRGKSIRPSDTLGKEARAKATLLTRFFQKSRKSSSAENLAKANFRLPSPRQAL
jgi:hypothetical protein